MSTVLAPSDALREVRVAVEGDLDLHTAGSVSESLVRACAQAPALVVLDLTAVEFMDCSVLTPVLAARRLARSRGGDLVVRGASPRCRRVLVLTGLAELLDDGARGVETV